MPIPRLMEVIFLLIAAMIVIGIFINANNNNSWTYINSDYAYTSYSNNSGANINSTSIVNLTNNIPVFIITGRENQRADALNITVANTNVTNITVNTVLNGVNLGNFTAINGVTTSNVYSVSCNSTLNTYNVKAYVTQVAGITLTSGKLTCSTSATGGYDLSGIIVIFVVILALFLFYEINKKKK